MSKSQSIDKSTLVDVTELNIVLELEMSAPGDSGLKGDETLLHTRMHTLDNQLKTQSWQDV